MMCQTNVATSSFKYIRRGLNIEVAIIGGGPSGIIAAKTLLEQDVKKIVLFEETSSLGGIWTREKLPEVLCQFENGRFIPSSSQPMYRDLRTNFPKDWTSFLGYPFPAEIEMFPEPPVVTKYYQDFAVQPGVTKITHLNTRVIICRKESDAWTIETEDTETNQRQQFTSKRLLVCNGHFRKAFCPDLPGLQHFQGKILHSSAFDSPQDYAHQTVLIVGGSVSGSDIAKILLTHGSCRRVILSARAWKLYQNFLLLNLQKNKGLIVRPGIERIDEQGRVHFHSPPPDKKHKYSSTTSATEQPDVILFATGYRYDFPFLIDSQPSPFVRSDGYKMQRLYKRILSIDDPSLAFLGIPNQNFSPALSLEYQAKWYAKMVLGDRLPSMEAMLQEVESRADDPTQDGLAAKFPSYCNSLATDVGCRGYWTQIATVRIPLMVRTSWTRRQARFNPFLAWMAGGAVIVLGVGLFAPHALLGRR